MRGENYSGSLYDGRNVVEGATVFSPGLSGTVRTETIRAGTESQRYHYRERCCRNRTKVPSTVGTVGQSDAGRHGRRSPLSLRLIPTERTGREISGGSKMGPDRMNGPVPVRVVPTILRPPRDLPLGPGSLSGPVYQQNDTFNPS